MASLFAVVENKAISQIIIRAVPEIQEERDEIRFGSPKTRAKQKFKSFICGKKTRLSIGHRAPKL